jgi:hypothetical protein
LAAVGEAARANTFEAIIPVADKQLILNDSRTGWPRGSATMTETS